MNALETLRNALASSDSPSYECRLCRTRFDDRPLNCPTCGCTSVERA